MTSLVSGERTPRVGLFLQLDRAPAVANVYDEVLDLIIAADALGFHSARVGAMVGCHRRSHFSQQRRSGHNAFALARLWLRFRLSNRFGSPKMLL